MVLLLLAPALVAEVVLLAGATVLGLLVLVDEICGLLATSGTSLWRTEVEVALVVVLVIGALLALYWRPGETVVGGEVLPNTSSSLTLFSVSLSGLR